MTHEQGQNRPQQELFTPEGSLLTQEFPKNPEKNRAAIANILSEAANQKTRKI